MTACQCWTGSRGSLRGLWNYERLGTPEWEAGYLYYTRNTGLQNQSPLYRRKGLGGRESLVLDPNRLSADGTVALSGWSVSRDGSHIATMTAASGSDWNEAQVMELRTRRRLPDRLKWLKFTEHRMGAGQPVILLWQVSGTGHQRNLETARHELLLPGPLPPARGSAGRRPAGL